MVGDFDRWDASQDKRAQEDSCWKKEKHRVIDSFFVQLRDLWRKFQLQVWHFGFKLVASRLEKTHIHWLKATVFRCALHVSKFNNKNAIQNLKKRYKMFFIVI